MRTLSASANESPPDDIDDDVDGRITEFLEQRGVSCDQSDAPPTSRRAWWLSRDATAVTSAPRMAGELDESGSDSAGGSGDQNPLGGNAGTLQQPLCRGVGTGKRRELAIGQGALDAKRFT